MRVKSIEFHDFRNLEDNKIYPKERVNIIFGDNAQGKTNLLEAVWLFCGGHSFRGAKESELLKFTKNSARLKMDFYSQQRDQSAEIRFFGNKREIEINNVKKPSSAYLSQVFSAVVFSPEHLSLIKNGPSLRRKFLDGAICQQDIRFALLLSKYNRTLLERNTLLKDMQRHRELRDTLFIWDDSLVTLGSQIIKKRIEYINKLKSVAMKFHLGISSDTELLDIKYESNSGITLEDDDKTISEKLIKSFNDGLREDTRLQCTNRGPHRDDISFLINGVKAKTYASQGQQRSIVLSLKLSEAQMLREYFSEPPVILLDDVLSEIDRKRQEYLIENTSECQTFITGCEQPQGITGDCGIFTVEKGRVE